jgi:RNA polymerase sigma factor (TIGR02999 family)
LFIDLALVTDITQLLNAVDQGDPHAASQLLPLVYEELRRLARQKLTHERSGQTLDPTALVHEAYLRLVGEQRFDNRRHFFAAAAEAMRRILIENARRKMLPKHGGGRRRIELNEAQRILESSDDLLLLDDALQRLAAEDATSVEMVKLRLFAGLSVEEAADALGLARATAYRHWSFARAWLRCELGEDGQPENLSDP